MPPLQLEIIEIEAAPRVVPSPLRVQQGRRFTPQQQILLYSADDWEEFTKEWCHYQKSVYRQVVRLAGAGDCGIDIAAFTDSDGVKGIWDCFQCKHYDDALTPTVAFPEIGKILWHSFQGSFKAPRKYYLIAPKGCGPKLQKLLLDIQTLKSSLIATWDKQCSTAITNAVEIKLEGTFLDYVNAFDFTIFSSKTDLEILDFHRNTPYYAERFGGNLPDRPANPAVPGDMQASESRYVTKLFGVYSEATGTAIDSIEALSTSQRYSSHFDRQRESFFSAEALRNFARDAVPSGTFEHLQDEVYEGVVEVEQSTHPTSFDRVNTVLQAATNLQISSNGLISVTGIKDLKGICHQLSNDDRINWKLSE